MDIIQKPGNGTNANSWQNQVVNITKIRSFIFRPFAKKIEKIHNQSNIDYCNSINNWNIIEKGVPEMKDGMIKSEWGEPLEDAL